MTRQVAGRFRPPVIAAHEVVRPRLLAHIARTDEPGEAFCTLVLGPAGFGKTTLLAQAYRNLQSLRRPAIWLECSELDADPAHLFDSLYVAGKAAGLAIDDSSFNASDFARRVAALGRAATLFLDGFERLVGSDAEIVVDRLLSILPAGVLIVIASRQVPGSWFMQRELRGLASTVDARELRLTHDEIVSLLPTRFTKAEIERVARLTEGWPVAVQMTRLRAGDTASISEMLDRLPHDGLGLFDFLASRVTESLSPLQRQLLRDASILSVITAPVANALLERDDGYALLSGVLRLQPIVTITGDDEFTVRLHPLFRQYLRLELARQGRDYEDRLHRRAAVTLAGIGSIHEGVQHALAAGDRDLAVQLFEQAGAEKLAFTIGPPKLHLLVASLPAVARDRSLALRFTDLILAAVDGRRRTTVVLRDELRRLLAAEGASGSASWRALATGFSDSLVAMLSDLHEGVMPGALARSADVERIARQHFAMDEAHLGLVLAIKVFLQSRYGAVADAQQALAEYVALCERNHFAPHLPSVSPQRGLLAFLAGDYDGACTLLTRSPGQRIDRFAEPEPLLVPLSTTILAAVHYERNELEAACRLVEFLAIDADRTFPEAWALAVRTRVMSLEALGRRDEAGRALLRDVNTARMHDARRMLIYLDAIDVELRLRHADADDRIGSLAASLEQELDRTEASWILIQQLARAVIPGLLYIGDLDRACRNSTHVVERATQCGHGMGEALGHLLRARVADALNDRAKVQHHLSAALVRTAGTRCLRLYVDLWPGSFAHLVGRLSDPDGARLSDHLRTVLRALETVRPEDASGWNSLSERERDVLAALSAHASTKAIARHLSLSPETVKHHLKRIFAKLGAHSRDEALQRVALHGR